MLTFQQIVLCQTPKLRIVVKTMRWCVFAAER